MIAAAVELDVHVHLPHDTGLEYASRLALWSDQQSLWDESSILGSSPPVFSEHLDNESKVPQQVGSYG